MDERALVLLRNTPANRPWLDRLHIDLPHQGTCAAGVGSAQGSLRLLDQCRGGLLFACSAIRNPRRRCFMRRRYTRKIQM